MAWGQGAFMPHSQNMPVVATRRQSVSLPHIILILLRRLAGLPHDDRPGMQGPIPLSFNATPNQRAS
jgi:hypothetical protein